MRVFVVTNRDVTGVINRFGRVDVRICRSGQPFVLEVNANPCLTKGSSY